MTSYDKYSKIVELIKADGNAKVSLTQLSNAIRRHFTIQQPSAIKFHIQSMQDMGMIRQDYESIGVWEIVEHGTKV